MCAVPERQIYSSCWVRGLSSQPEPDHIWIGVIASHLNVWRAGYVETAIEAASAIMTHLRDRGACFSNFEFERLIDMIAEILCHVPRIVIHG